MTRMTNDAATTITRRIIDFKFKEPLQDADKARKDAAEAFYAALYRNFLKAMDSLPEIAFTRRSYIKISTLHGERKVNFHAEKPVFRGHDDGYGRVSLPVTPIEAEQGNNPIHKAAHVAVKTEEAHKALSDTLNKEYDTCFATIRAYTTIEKLVAALPSVEPFVFGITDKVVQLPVVQVEAFNTRFGLPADPKLVRQQIEGSTDSSQGNSDIQQAANEG